MINWNGRRYIPAGIKPVLGKRTGAPVPGRPKARWVAGWVSGLGEEGITPEPPLNCCIYDVFTASTLSDACIDCNTTFVSFYSDSVSCSDISVNKMLDNCGGNPIPDDVYFYENGAPTTIYKTTNGDGSLVVQVCPTYNIETQDGNDIVTQSGDNLVWTEPECIAPSPTPTPSVTVTPTMTMTPTPTPTPPAGDPDALAYLADVVAAGGTTDATIDAAVETLFVDLKSAGVYSKLDILYPFVGGTASSHSINALGNTSYDITWNGGLTHNASGTTGNGTNGYGNTNYNPNVEATAGDIGYGLYQTLGNFGAEKYSWGAYQDGSYLITYRGDGATSVGLFGYTVSIRDAGVTTVSNEGHFMAHFSGSGTNYKQMYYNYSDVTNGDTNTGNAGTNIGNPNFNYYLFVLNFNGSPYASNYTTTTIRSFYHGLALTPTEALAIDTAINDFQTSLGRNIY